MDKGKFKAFWKEVFHGTDDDIEEVVIVQDDGDIIMQIIEDEFDEVDELEDELDELDELEDDEF